MDCPQREKRTIARSQNTQKIMQNITSKFAEAQNPIIFQPIAREEIVAE